MWGHVQDSGADATSPPTVPANFGTRESHLDSFAPTRIPPSKTLTMPSVLLLVFLLQLTIHIINKFGAQTINDLVSSLLD